MGPRVQRKITEIGERTPEADRETNGDECNRSTREKPPLVGETARKVGVSRRGADQEQTDFAAGQGAKESGDGPDAPHFVNAATAEDESAKNEPPDSAAKEPRGGADGEIMARELDGIGALDAHPGRIEQGETQGRKEGQGAPSASEKPRGKALIFRWIEGRIEERLRATLV